MGKTIKKKITCSKLTTEKLEKGVTHVDEDHFDVFIVNFEHISHLFLMVLLLTLNK